MNNIIDFKNKNENKKHDYLIIKTFKFTCPNCNNKFDFNCNGMIFKTIELFCNSCGTKHKVSNPGFKNEK